MLKEIAHEKYKRFNRKSKINFYLIDRKKSKSSKKSNENLNRLTNIDRHLKKNEYYIK